MRTFATEQDREDYIVGSFVREQWLIKNRPSHEHVYDIHRGIIRRLIGRPLCSQCISETMELLRVVEP